MEEFSREEMLLGNAAMSRLAQSRVMIFGIGGVGSYVAEGLARGGIGNFILIDHDRITRSNINRQIHALQETIGKKKVEIMKQRILSINPTAKVDIHAQFYMPELRETFFNQQIDYVVDAVDTVTAKLDIISTCKEKDIPVISCMGTGNKLHPEMLQLSDISKTSMCPLAKVMRRELKKRGITHVDVLFSTETPIRPQQSPIDEKNSGLERTPGSVSFVPSVAGLFIAGHVIRKLI